MNPERPLRIAHVTNYQVPGYGYEELALARVQHRLGHDVVIVTSNYLHPRGAYAVLRERFPDRKIAPREEIEDGVRILRLPSVEFGTRTWIRGLERVLIGLKPDVVHCHNLLVFHPLRLALLKLTNRLSVGLVVDDHTLYSAMRRGVRGRAFYFAYRNFLHPLLASQVDSFCAATVETREYLIKHCGVRGPIRVMPLGVDADAFSPRESQRLHTRAELGFQQDDFVVLYTGKVVPSKGIALLVQAAIRLIESGQPIKVLIVGDSEPRYSAILREQVVKAGKQRYFQFLPSVPHDELAGFYSAADIAVWPGVETMAVYEAMATAVPVIVPESSGYARLIDEKAGVTFRPNDAVSLADSIDRLRTSSVRQHLGAGGRHLVDQEFSWRHAAQRYLAEYRAVLGGPAAAQVADPART